MFTAWSKAINRFPRKSAAVVNRAAVLAVESLETRRLMAHVPEIVDTSPEAFEQWGQFMAAKGDRVLVGNSGQMVDGIAGVGEANLFNSDGTLAATFENPSPDLNDAFGAAVAFVGSDKVAISSLEPDGAGKVFIFDLSGTPLNEIESPFGPFNGWGFQLASWENGTDNYLLVSGLNDGSVQGNGSVRVYNADTGAYTGLEINNDDTPMPGLQNDGFGNRMAVSGNTLVVGANAFDLGNPTNSTSVVFQFNLAPGVTPTATHVRTYTEQSVSPAQDSDDLGFGSFALAIDGNNIFIGESTDNPADAGFDRNEFVHQFNATTGAPVHTYAYGVTPGADVGFGLAITVSDGKLAIGAQGHNETTSAGAVFSYDVASHALIERIDNPHTELDTTVGSQFGYTLATLDNGRIVVGDPSRDVETIAGTQVAAGALYVYTLADLPTGPASPTAAMSGGNLVVTGTAAGDTLEIRAAGANTVGVYSGATLIGTFAVSGKIIVNAGDGHDSVAVGANVTIDAELHGGNGNDTLLGGGGNDLLIGDAGNDSLTSRNASDIAVGGEGNDIVLGGNGRDVLIGGNGADYISGDNAEDILIAGFTAHDNDMATLAAIRTIWNGSATREARIASLESSYLAASNVFGDADIDTVLGGSGMDWFLVDDALEAFDIRKGG